MCVHVIGEIWLLLFHYGLKKKLLVLFSLFIIVKKRDLVFRENGLSLLGVSVHT